jgi:hypothetical protein
MSADNVEIAAWIAGLAALAVALLAWFPWMQRNLRHAAFGDMLLKLAGAGELDRARKLCAAASPRPMGVAMGACLDALDGRDEPAAERLERLREVYRRSMAASLAPAKQLVGYAAVVLVAGAVAAYLVLERGAATMALVPAVMALPTLYAAWRTARRIAVECAAQGERVLPVLAG